MKLTPQSIRNNVRITWNGEPISKQEIIDMSAHWNEKQITYFKKIVKQGGTFKTVSYTHLTLPTIYSV